MLPADTIELAIGIRAFDDAVHRNIPETTH